MKKHFCKLAIGEKFHDGKSYGAGAKKRHSKMARIQENIQESG